MSHPFRTLCLLFLLSLTTTTLHAQFYNGMNMEFGKNRVQWGDFKWSYYRYDNFDIYYYQGGEDFAQYVRQYASQLIPIMESRLDSRFGKKMQFIIFNRMSDFKQSNIDNEEEESGNTGGTTKIIGTKAVLCFDGNYEHFETQIRKSIAQLLMQQAMNGTSIGSQIRSSYRYEIPEWFQNGLCAYIADDWDSYKEDRLQSGILSGRYKKLNQLRDDDATIAGHSFWNYIQENYGPRAFSEIIDLSQSTQNVKKALLYVTGKKYKELLKDWYGFYRQRYEGLLQHRPESDMKLRYRDYRTFFQPEISPDGKHLAYVSNTEGKIELWVEDLQSGKRHRAFRAGYRSDLRPDCSYPLLAWHPNGEILSFILEEEGKIMLYNLDIASGKQASTYLFEFQKVTAFAYAHKSRKIVLAATRNGKPDIYVYNLFSNTSEQITDDFYTDLSPVFSADDRQIYFSSNRSGTTLDRQTKPDTQNRQFNLFSYDYVHKTPQLQSLTRSKVSNSIAPNSLRDGSLLYLCDSSGFYNLFQAQIDSAISYIDTTIHYRYFTRTRQLTNYSSSIIDYSYHPREKRVVMLLPDKKGEKFFLSPYLTNTLEAATNQMNPYAQKRLSDLQKNSLPDTLKHSSKHRFSTSYRQARRKRPVFDSIGNPISSVEPMAQPIPVKPPKKDSIQRPNNYYVELFTNELVSQIDFSCLNYSYQPFTGGHAPVYLNSGFNVFLGTTLTDLMEDFKIDLGVKLNTSLVNNEYIVRFRDLSKRLDKSLTFHRFVTDDQFQYYYYRTFTDEAFYTLSYPFNETLSLRGTVIYRNDYRVNLSVDDSSLADRNTMENWGGVRGELVYDNAKKLETNLYVGTRGKVFAEYYQLAARNTSNLIVTGFDIRNYTRIHRNFIWANRLAGSTSLGQSRLIYYMGGVDNWIFAKFDERTPIDYSQNYAYQTLATNMRGFSQNIRNGNSFVVLNSELRLPVFTYFTDRPINMQFIKNFQIVAFGDLGTAWTGWNPYDLDNSLYTSHHYDGNLHISVTEQKNPLVGGIGLGLRTTVFGYFIRGDMAWGIEDGRISKKPQFYLSFNLDF